MLALALPALLKAAWGLRYPILLVAMLAAFAWWSHHERAIGAAAIQAAVEKATVAEHDRRMQTLEWAQRWAQGAIQNVDALRKRDAKLQAKIAQLSAALDRNACLDAGAADQLRQIGANRSAAGGGVIQPAR